MTLENEDNFDLEFGGDLFEYRKEMDFEIESKAEIIANETPLNQARLCFISRKDSLFGGYNDGSFESFMIKFALQMRNNLKDKNLRTIIFLKGNDNQLNKLDKTKYNIVELAGNRYSRSKKFTKLGFSLNLLKKTIPERDYPFLISDFIKSLYFNSGITHTLNRHEIELLEEDLAKMDKIEDMAKLLELKGEKKDKGQNFLYATKKNRIDDYLQGEIDMLELLKEDKPLIILYYNDLRYDEDFPNLMAFFLQIIVLSIKYIKNIPDIYLDNLMNFIGVKESEYSGEGSVSPISVSTFFSLEREEIILNKNSVLPRFAFGLITSEGGFSPGLENYNQSIIEDVIWKIRSSSPIIFDMDSSFLYLFMKYSNYPLHSIQNIISLGERIKKDNEDSKSKIRYIRGEDFSYPDSFSIPDRGFFDLAHIEINDHTINKLCSMQEHESLEFKPSYYNYEKEICNRVLNYFQTYKGGNIIIGITERKDSSKYLSGINEKDREKGPGNIRNDLYHRIKDKIHPLPNEQELQFREYSINGERLIAITVYPSKKKRKINVKDKRFGTIGIGNGEK